MCSHVLCSSRACENRSFSKHCPVKHQFNHLYIDLEVITIFLNDACWASIEVGDCAQQLCKHVCFFNIANWNEAHGIISFNSILFPCQKPICLTSTLGGRSNTSNWAQSKGIEGSALSNSEAFQDSKVMQAVMDFWKGSGSFDSLETVSLCLLLIAQTTTILQPVSVRLGQKKAAQLNFPRMLYISFFTPQQHLL